MRKRRDPGQVWFALPVVLTVVTGIVDVLTFTRLGTVFSSVMTGNLVLLGLAASKLSVSAAVEIGVALGGYVVGVALGVPLSARRPTDGPWPAGVTITLGLELCVLVGFTVGWEVARAEPAGFGRFVLLAMAAIAMGLQAAAVRGMGPEVSISTTFLTGTLTGVVAGLVGRTRSGVDFRAMAVLLALASGAGMAGILLTTAPLAVPILPVVLVSTVIAFALWQRKLDISLRSRIRADQAA